MQTGEMRAAVEQARAIGAYADKRKSQQCFCGRFKWTGVSFCTRCIRKLPVDYKAALYGPVSKETAFAYDSCVAHLVAMDFVKPFDGKL